MAQLSSDEIHRTEQIVRIDGVPWYVVLHWAETQGRAEVVGIELWSRPPPDAEQHDALLTGQLSPPGMPVTSSVVRQLNVGSLIKEGRRDAIGLHESVIASEGFSERAKAASERGLEQMGQPGRPPRYDERHYIEVARVYQAAYEDNRTPTRAVAAHFAISQPQAAKWVSTARNKYGLLGPTTKGRATGITRVRGKGGDL